jgi:hypothetical protein
LLQLTKLEVVMLATRFLVLPLYLASGVLAVPVADPLKVEREVVCYTVPTATVTVAVTVYTTGQPRTTESSLSSVSHWPTTVRTSTTASSSSPAQSPPGGQRQYKNVLYFTNW